VADGRPPRGRAGRLPIGRCRPRSSSRRQRWRGSPRQRRPRRACCAARTLAPLTRPCSSSVGIRKARSPLKPTTSARAGRSGRDGHRGSRSRTASPPARCNAGGLQHQAGHAGQLAGRPQSGCDSPACCCRSVRNWLPAFDALCALHQRSSIRISPGLVGPVHSLLRPQHARQPGASAARCSASTVAMSDSTKQPPRCDGRRRPARWAPRARSGVLARRPPPGAGPRDAHAGAPGGRESSSASTASCATWAMCSGFWRSSVTHHLLGELHRAARQCRGQLRCSSSAKAASKDCSSAPSLHRHLAGMLQLEGVGAGLTVAQVRPGSPPGAPRPAARAGDGGGRGLGGGSASWRQRAPTWGDASRLSPKLSIAEGLCRPRVSSLEG
jgi:hypothetical protein